jgi:phosphonate transport system substrate-binding protein
LKGLSSMLNFTGFRTARRPLVRAALAGAAMAILATTGAQAQQRDLLLAISEGTSGGLDHSRVIVKYGPFANMLGDAMKRRVVLVFAREFAALEEGMKTGKFDLVMARPSDYPARATRDYGFKYVAHAKPDGQCFLIVPKNSAVKTLAEAKGKRWIFPEKVAYMTKFCTAELRDQGINLETEKVQYVKEQATIGSYLDTNLADVGGIASYSGLAANMAKNGHVAIHKSRPQPYFPIVAGKAVTPKQLQDMQKMLDNIENLPGGKEVLASIGVADFDVTGKQRLTDLLAWIEKK